LNFLTNAVKRIPEFEALLGAVINRRLPAAVNGVSTVHKANIITSLCALTKHRAFVVAADEGEATFYLTQDGNFVRAEYNGIILGVFRRFTANQGNKAYKDHNKS